MTRDEALERNYTQKGLVRAVANGFLYDYVAQWYYQMSPYELKEVLLAVLGVTFDNCKSDEDEKAFSQLVVNELADRDFGSEE